MIFEHFKEWVEFWKTPVESEMRGNYEQFEWVRNGSVDVKWRPVLKTKSGGRKASVFTSVTLSTLSIYYHNDLCTPIAYLIILCMKDSKKIPYLTILCMNCAVLVSCDSIAYVSIAFNMIIYLITVLDEGVATSVKNVNASNFTFECQKFQCTQV